MTPITPLDTFRQHMQLSPFWFWGLANQDVPLLPDCDALVREYGWQGGGSAGRDDIRAALEQAEAMLRDELGYSVAPHYVTETLPFPRHHDMGQNRIVYAGSDGRWLALQLREARTVAVGVETRTLIGQATVAGGALAFSDADGDGLDDTFTITMATTVTDPDEIAVYFTSADRLDGEAVGERWRVQPIKISITAGTATIKGRYWTLVKPIKHQRVGLGALDPMEQTGTPAVRTNVAVALDVYRRHCNPAGITTATAQAMLVWESSPWPKLATAVNGATFDDDVLDPAAQAYAIARATVRDARRGIVGLGEATWDATNSKWVLAPMSFTRPPDRVVVRYLAGDALVGGQVNPHWARVVSRFAAALLGRRVCGCDSVSREFSDAQIDLAFSGNANTEKFLIDPGELKNPFGTRRGMIEAWRAVQDVAEIRAVLA